MLKTLILLSLLAEIFEFKKYVVTVRDRKKQQIPNVETSVEPIQPVKEAGQDYSDMALDVDEALEDHDYHHKEKKCDCGIMHVVHDYVIGGRVANERRYPWMVEIKTLKEDGWYNCGGSIITARKVTTSMIFKII